MFFRSVYIHFYTRIFISLLHSPKWGARTLASFAASCCCRSSTSSPSWTKMARIILIIITIIDKQWGAGNGSHSSSSQCLRRSRPPSLRLREPLWQGRVRPGPGLTYAQPGQKPEGPGIEDAGESICCVYVCGLSYMCACWNRCVWSLAYTLTPWTMWWCDGCFGWMFFRFRWGSTIFDWCAIWIVNR